MRVREKFGLFEGEIVGVLDYTHERATVLVVTDDGIFRHASTSMLIPIIEKPTKPDMRVTVGHIVDNPTFNLGNNFEIVDLLDDGTVNTLYDSRNNNKPVPTEFLVKTVTYMTASESRPGVLVIYV